MTGKKYSKQMHALVIELERAASTEPYDPEAHGDVVTKINNLNHLWHISLHRRHWFFVAFIFFLLAVLSFIGGVILW